VGAPANLEAAREAFLPFSTNVVGFVQQVRAQEDTFRSLKVYYCPMAPKPGLWFQAEGPLRNPYYGAEMLTCGQEVKPAAAAVQAAATSLNSSAARSRKNGSLSAGRDSAATNQNMGSILAGQQT